MLLLDVIPPDVETPVIVMAQANPAQPRSDGLYGVLGVCSPVFKAVYDGPNVVSSNKVHILPGDMAMFLFLHRGEIELFDSSKLLDAATEHSVITIIKSPEHGMLERERNNFFTYKAKQGYKGTDRAEFLVEFEGYRVKVVYYIHVTGDVASISDDRVWNAAWEKYCPLSSWEITSNKKKVESLEIDDPANWYQTLSLQVLLMGAKDAPFVLVADAQHVGRERMMGICSAVDNLWNALPGETARQYLMRYENKTLQDIPPLASLKDIRIVKQAEHGHLSLAEDKNYGYMGLTYIPDKDYLGKDQFEVVVFMGNDSVRIVYYLVVQSESPDQLSGSELEKLCPKVEWIISQASPEDYNTPSSWYRATSLQSLLMGAKDALTDAVGTWFIDYTSYLDEEWLPTSSAAKGKSNKVSAIDNPDGSRMAQGARSVSCLLSPVS